MFPLDIVSLKSTIFYFQNVNTGRRMMANTPYPYGGIYVKPPTSKSKYSNQKGKRWETYYKPNSEIGTGPSHSGHGGSSIEHVSSP
ncbi:hypothetical protein AtEden1_Chr5g0129511 [Arabidopsis thaliana]